MRILQFISNEMVWANYKKQAWKEFSNNGYQMNGNVLYWLNQLPDDIKQEVKYQMEHPQTEE